MMYRIGIIIIFPCSWHSFRSGLIYATVSPHWTTLSLDILGYIFQLRKNRHFHPKKYLTCQRSTTVHELEIYFPELTLYSLHTPLPYLVDRNVLPQPITRQSAVWCLDIRMEGLCLFALNLLYCILTWYRVEYIFHRLHHTFNPILIDALLNQPCILHTEYNHVLMLLSV